MRLNIKENIVDGNTIEILIVSSDETTDMKNKEIVRNAINTLNYTSIKGLTAGSISRILYMRINKSLGIESNVRWIRIRDPDKSYVEYP